MKRTAGALTLLAALGGCMSTNQPGSTGEHFGQVGRAKEVPGVVGPWGQPVAQTANGMAAPATGVVPVSVRGASDGLLPALSEGPAPMPSNVQQVSWTGPTSKAAAKTTPTWGKGNGKVPPPPPAGPAGAVAAVGALPGGMPTMGNARTHVKFAGPDGMKIAWLAPTPDGRVGFRPQLEAPGRFNFLQGAVYRLKLSDIAKRAGLELYPTIEVVPQNPKTITFLAHSAIPLTFTDDDFEQVASGNFVVKVIYLPDPQFQDLATAGPDEVVSTRLDPGVDPIQEAQRRGSVLLIVRMGNIDLEAPHTPGMEMPNPYLRGPAMMSGAPMAPAPLPPKMLPPPAPGSKIGTNSLPTTLPNLPLPKPSNAVVLP